MNIRFLKIITCLVLSVLLCSCQTEGVLSSNPENKSKIKTENLESIINNTDSYDELITKDIDIHSFINDYGVIHGSHRNTKINQVASDIGIECLRHTDTNSLYTVYKVKQGGLIYIFYHTYLYGICDFEEMNLNQWFYVCNKISYDDFKNIKLNVSTLKDIIKIDKGAYIFDDIFHSNRGIFDTGMETWHYLEDGICHIQYDYIDGELVVVDIILEDTFDLRDKGLSVKTPCDAHILQMDWVK